MHSSERHNNESTVSNEETLQLAETVANKRQQDLLSVTEESIETNCNCAGVFVIRTESKQKLSVLLVESKRKNYQFSFPKGKRDKGETTLETAKRELHEETGLTESDYELIPNKWYVEYRSDTGKPHIVYYLAQLSNKDVKLDPIDKKEILSAKWFTPEEIYNMKRSLYLQRRQITTRAIRDFKTRLLLQKNVTLYSRTTLAHGSHDHNHSHYIVS